MPSSASSPPRPPQYPRSHSQRTSPKSSLHVLPRFEQRPLAEYRDLLLGRAHHRTTDDKALSREPTQPSGHLRILNSPEWPRSMTSSHRRRDNLPVSRASSACSPPRPEPASKAASSAGSRTPSCRSAKLLADFDFEFQTGIDKSQILELATLGFLERKQGLIIGGSRAPAKATSRKLCCSSVAEALPLPLHHRRRDAQGSHVLPADGTLEQKLKTYTRPHILLID